MQVPVVAATIHGTDNVFVFVISGNWDRKNGLGCVSSWTRLHDEREKGDTHIYTICHVNSVDFLSVFSGLGHSDDQWIFCV